LTIFTAWRNGRAAPIFYGKEEVVTDTYTKERELQQQLTEKVEERVAGTEVLAVELLAPDRFCVYIDHPQGVDHALCQRVTQELDEYRRDYTIDVSSPGLERPLRKPDHFARAVGRHVKLKTASRQKVRGEVLAAEDKAVRIAAAGGDPILIPYDEIVRGNLIDEG